MIRWLDQDQQMLGQAFTGCVPVYQACVTGNKPKAEVYCKGAWTAEGFKSESDCVNYYWQLYNYQVCKPLCPAMNPQPPEKPPGVTPITPANFPPSAPTKPAAETRTGWIIAGVAAVVVIGAIVYLS